MAGKQSAAMDKAQKSIESGKMNAQQAAAKFGLSAVSIQRKEWYLIYTGKKPAKAAP